MRITGYTGLNTIDNPLDVGLQGLTVAKNINLDHNGKPSTREGFTKLVNKQIVGMSNGIVLCADGDLLRINSSDSIETIAHGIPGQSINCVDCAHHTYFATGLYNGVISGSAVRSMGLHPPAFDIVTGLGGLPAGNYLVSVTSVSEDGRESGSNAAESIYIGANSSITISVTLPSGAVTANIYCSGQDGEELFYQSTATQLTITGLDALLNSGEPINREYKGVMPFGRLIEEYNGHLFIASNEYLYHSDPLDYELCDYINNIIPFDSAITMLKSVETGIYISTSKEVLFASGGNPDQWTIRQVYNYPAFYNSGSIIPATLVGDGGQGKSVIFTTQQGICVGNADGSVMNVSERKIKLLNHSGDVSAVINHNRYVVSLLQ
jgi:hypothetical protein